MQTKIDRRVHASAPQEDSVEVNTLSLRQPSRLGWRLTLGVIIEGVTLVVVMVTLATHQFSIMTYILAVLGILLPLLLLTWGFRLLTKDEIHSRQEMRRGEKSMANSFIQEKQRPLAYPQLTDSPAPTRELVHV